MIFEYEPKGVCSVKIVLEIENDIIKSAKFIKGCNGNTQGICALIKGMNIDEVIKRLKGIDCQMRGTSCPDQLAKALEEYKTRSYFMNN